MDAVAIVIAKYLIAVPVIVLGAYFLMRPRSEWKRMVLFAVPAGLLAYALALLGSHLYFDPRPFVAGNFTPLIPHAADNGFPSDHTLLASAFAAVGTFWDKKLGAALWLMTIVIGGARVYAGLHHSIDVLGSMVFGILGALAWYACQAYAASRKI